MKRVTKTQQVLDHLKQYGFISTWTAIQSYGATRLSAIIFNLRKRGYDISTTPQASKDRNGNVCTFAIYHLNTK